MGNTALAAAHATPAGNGQLNAMRIDNALGTNAAGTAKAMSSAISNGAKSLVSGNGETRGEVLGEIAGAVIGAKGMNAAVKGVTNTLAKTTAVGTEAVAIETLAIGPAGDAGATLTKQIPSGWNMTTTRNGQGTLFTDPVNPRANNVRVQSGNPNSPNVSQQNPYVRQTVNGRTVDSRGNPSISPTETHIPKNDFNFNQ